MSRRILVAVAWPYASGPRHLGHLAGAYLPADIFARYHRLAGNQVLMVSGSDVHGTPITVRADQEGVEPQVIVDRYHNEFLRDWETLGISWDLYTSTGTPNHYAVTQDVFLRLLENGYLAKKTSSQFYDPEAQRFLPDRYVQGTCPNCGYGEARGDQCDNCGKTLDPVDLIDPVSRLSGARPVERETEHYFLLLSKLEDRLRGWLETKTTWRRHVRNWALGMVNEGLPDRAITRDLEWGVPLPVDDLGPGKRIYVWFDAVIGYLSASKEWAQRQGDPESWRLWWEDPEAESYYFVGKDNIPFHTVIWPAMLMGYGGLNLPTDVPANQYVTFGSQKASASRGIGRSIGWYAERLQPDALRYALGSVLPEHQDTDLSDEEIIRRVNEELVATWGNLVNRVLTISARNFDGRVPDPGPLTAEDEAIVAVGSKVLEDTAAHIEKVELRSGLRAAMDAASTVNAYLNATEPWKLIKTDAGRAATVLWSAIQAIAGIRVALHPYIPHSSARVGEMLGIGAEITSWTAPRVEGGTPLGEVTPLFTKLDESVLDD
ncbi:MAG: methionine--tRNA ligase [Actinomycetes bacterium]|jgi:methionyl-tRNA synthetase|nr:MAG: methionine--tRNA ligase [Actinomycetota bacterium]